MKSITESVKQRLLNKAREQDVEFNYLLTRYAVERFLYRLSISEERDKFILKGGSLLLVWTSQEYRVTRDADFLYRGIPDFRTAFTSICAIEPPSGDGIVFLPDTISITEVKHQNEYGGYRIVMTAMLGQARVPLQFDVGIGDVITPGYDFITYPTLLDHEPPILKAYPRDTFIAEKVHALAMLGEITSRMKDFFDIWFLARHFEFNGTDLCMAISNTFQYRNTPIPETLPVLLESYFGRVENKTQWAAFLRRSYMKADAIEFASVIEMIARFLIPVLESLRTNSTYHAQWTPEQGWVNNTE